MKAKVLQIIRNALSNAEDNLHRANMQFGKMTSEQLDEGYGDSGLSCRVIWDGYRANFDELNRCVAWVEGAEDEDE